MIFKYTAVNYNFYLGIHTTRNYSCKIYSAKRIEFGKIFIYFHVYTLVKIP